MYNFCFFFEDFFRALLIQGDLMCLSLRMYSRMAKLASQMSVSSSMYNWGDQAKNLKIKKPSFLIY